MLISPTSLANMATMSLFGASTWPSWRHMQTHDLGRYDLKQKNQDALRNTKTMVILCANLLYLDDFSIVSSIEFNWLGVVLRLRFNVLGFVMLLMIRKRRLSKWRQIKMCFVFSLICPNNLINMASMSLSFLLPNMTSHRQTHSKDKSAKLKKQS